MLVRPVLSELARHHKLHDVLCIGSACNGEGSALGGRFASTSRHYSQNSQARQQPQLSSTSNVINTEHSASSSDSSVEHSMQLLRDHGRRQEYRIREARIGRRSSRSIKAAPSAVSSEDVSSWKQQMNEKMGRQGEQIDHITYEGGKRRSQKEVIRRADRARVLAQTMESSRSKQPKESPPEGDRRILSSTLIVPGGGGNNVYSNLVQFEATEIHYPPSDIYPPPLPIVQEVDLLLAARALGVIKSCEVEWNAKEGCWRKTSRSNEFYEQERLSEFLDTEQALEYLGDSVLSLISRSLIMSQFPGKTVAVYNMASSWLVSNDCFAYMLEDSRLEEERINVARNLAAVNRKREVKRISQSLTPEEILILEQAPLPEPVLPQVSHRRKADLFEAYVGSVYQTYGFQTTSKWCTMLLEPWLDLINRTKDFHQEKFLSPSGEASRRVQLRQEKEEEEERIRSTSWWGKMRSRFLGRTE